MNLAATSDATIRRGPWTRHQPDPPHRGARYSRGRSGMGHLREGQRVLHRPVVRVGHTDEERPEKDAVWRDLRADAGSRHDAPRGVGTDGATTCSVAGARTTTPCGNNREGAVYAWRGFRQRPRARAASVARRGRSASTRRDTKRNSTRWNGKSQRTRGLRMAGGFEGPAGCSRRPAE